MAKKNKKKHRPSKALSRQALAQRARNHLSAGRFRQAVDDYKTLIKQDREAYLPGLRTAYEGLYNQRLDKGMLAEAGMVLDQLEKLSGDIPCVESIRMWLKRREFTKAAEVAIKVLAGGAQSPENDSALVADALITAFDETPPLQNVPDVVGDHMQRIHTALTAVAAQQYPQALAAVKAIGLRSIFFSWKCLIKGYCAFYRQEDAKALAAFNMIAAETVPEAAAAPYVQLLAYAASDSADVTRDPEVIEPICAVAGYPEIAPALARAEYLWQVERFRDSHTHMLGTLAHFPTLSSGLAHTLTEFYYNACFELPTAPARKYFLQLVRSAKGNGNGNGLAQFWASRSAALYLEQQDSDEEILEQWEHFLSLEPSLYARMPKVRALVYGRLGNLFSEEIPNDYPFGFFPSRRHRNTITLRNAELARHCYEKSLQADPGGLDTQLSLIGFFEKIDDHASVNRHLDQVIKQFPGEKDVLFKAGARCLARNARVKAMNYLDKALTLDPTDRNVREVYCLACIQAAHNYALQGKADKAKALLPRVIDASDAHSDHFNLGRAYLYARWAAFDQLTGNDAEADRIWEQALAHQQAGEFKVHLFYWIVAQYYGVPKQYVTTHYAIITKGLKGRANADTAAVLADILCYASLLPEPVAGLASKAATFDKYILRAAGTTMSRSQAKSIMEYALCEECDRPKIAKRCVDNMLKRHPEDAFFRFHRFLAQYHSTGPSNDISEDIAQLTTIVQLARKQRETQVAASAQKMIKELEQKSNTCDMLDNLADKMVDVFDDMLDNDCDERDLEVMCHFLNDLLEEASQENNQPRNKTPKKEKKPKGPEQLNLF